MKRNLYIIAPFVAVAALVAVLIIMRPAKPAITGNGLPASNAPGGGVPGTPREKNASTVPGLPAGTGSCVIKVKAETEALTRSDALSEVFGVVKAGDTLLASGWTLDGFIGFEPGVAQAPNVGPFRLRWFAPGSPLEFGGNCAGLQQFPNVSARTCFAMAQSNVPVYKSENVTSSEVARMGLGDYVEVVVSPDQMGTGWLEVISPEGTLASGIRGYIRSGEVSLNGPCDPPKGS